MSLRGLEVVRRVSGRPGAEGAPLLGCDEVLCLERAVLVVVDGWWEGGAMRRDWLEVRLVILLIQSQN